MNHQEYQKLFSNLKNEIKLYKRYENVNCILLQMRYHTHYMRTEVCVSEPKIVVPQIFRQYELQLYLVNGVIHDYESLSKTPEWKANPGTSNHNHIWLYEIFHDCGDDGHIDNQLRGWAFIDDEKIQAKKNDPEIQKCRYTFDEIIHLILREAEDNY